MIEFLRIQARSFIFTASGVPAAVGAALAAVKICRSPEGPPLFAAVLDNARYLHDGLAAARLRGRRADDAGGRHRDRHPGRAGAGRRRLEGGAAVEGAV